MSSKIEIADEFNAEAQEVAKFTRELLYLSEARINMLCAKAKEKGWYTGADTHVERLLFEFCKNTHIQRDWLDFAGASRLQPSENTTT